MKTAPCAILFDLGGTLLNETQFDREAGRAHMLSLAHNPRGATLSDYASIIGEMMDIWSHRDDCLLEFPKAAIDRHVYERAGLTFDLSPEELELEYWKAAVQMQPEPGILDVLEELVARDLPMGVVSNSAFSQNTLSWELDKHGLLDAFHFVMSSANYAVRKPHPMLFRTAAMKLNAQLETVWFIGDNLAVDIIGANQAGMHAIWYNPKKVEVGEIDASSVRTISDWHELLTLLEA